MNTTSTPEQSKKRLPLWAKLILGVLVFLLIGVVAARWFVSSAPARNMIEQQVEGLEISGQTISIDAFKGDVFSDFSIGRITLSDTEGVWGELEDIHLKWKPAGLIGRKLDVSELDIARLHLIRQPIMPEPEEKASGGSGSMPLKAISLGAFKLDAFLIEKGITPEEVSGSASASIDWTPAIARFDADIHPGNEGGDLLAAHIGWSEKKPLNGTVELVGPANGLFATLLQLETDQSVSADFKAEGLTRNVTGQGDIRIDDAPWISIGIAPDGDVYRADTEIDLTAHPLTKAQTDKLGDALTISALINRTRKTPEQLLRVEVNTQGVRALVDDIVLSKARRTAHVILALDDSAQLLPADVMSLAQARLEGEVSAHKDRYVFEGEFSGNGFSQSQLSMQKLSGPIRLTFEDQMLQAETGLRAETLRLKLSEDKPTRLAFADLEARASYDIEAGGVRVETLSLRLPKSTLSLREGSTYVPGGRFDLAGSSRFDLVELGLYEAGRVDGNWSLVGEDIGEAAFSVDANARGLEGKDESLKDWLGDGVKLRLRGNVSNASRVRLRELKLNTKALTLTGSGQLNDQGAVNFAGQLAMAESYPLAETLPGLSANFSANGLLENLSLKAEILAERAGSEEGALEDFRLGFDGQWNNAVLKGAANLSGIYDAAPVTLSTDVFYGDGQWQLSDAKGDWESLKLTGGLSGQGGDIASLEGAFLLDGALPDGLPAQDISLEVNAKGELLSAKGLLNGIDTDQLHDGKLDFALQGNRAAFDYQLGLAGMTEFGILPTSSTLDVTGTVSGLSDGVPNVTGALQAKLGDDVIATPEPFAFFLAEGGPQGHFDLSLFGGTMAVRLGEEASVPLDVTFTELDLEPLFVFLGRPPMQGQANLQLRLEETDGVVRGDLTGRLQDLYSPGSEATPVSFDLVGLFDAEKGEIRVDTPDIQMLQGELDLTLPLGVQASAPYFQYQPDGAGQVRLKLDGPVDNMSALFLPEAVILQGEVGALIEAPLPFSLETVTGNIGFKKGVFQHGEMGTDLEKINFDVTLANQMLTLENFTANGRKGGSLTGDGSVSMAGGFASTVSLTADKLVVVNRREANAVASGTLGLDLSEEAYQIIGDLQLNEGEFRIDSLPSASVTTLDVQFGDEEQEEVKEPLISLKLDVAAPHSLKITGHGMDAELSLDAEVRGTGSDPLLFGSASIVRGRFELLGKRFVFSDSKIEFRGNPLDAQLNIEAERETDDFTAIITITGTPEQPKITLTSDPELPDDEVLSRVLFGRSPSQLSALEAARLGAALASMTGGGGFDLMGGIEALTGLDSVDVSQNSDGQFQLAAGRYLTDDVYMQVTTGGTGMPGVSVEWEARNNISVEAETKPDEGQTLSVQWKKDFE